MGSCEGLSLTSKVNMKLLGQELKQNRTLPHIWDTNNLWFQKSESGFCRAGFGLEGEDDDTSVLIEVSGYSLEEVDAKLVQGLKATAEAIAEVFERRTEAKRVAIQDEKDALREERDALKSQLDAALSALDRLRIITDPFAVRRP